MMEGDSNSKHFHFIIKWSRRKNSIRGLSLNGEWVEEPLRAKEEVLKFFQSRFQVIGGNGVSLDGVPFATITMEDNMEMECVFGEIEVKEAVGKCESDKSPGLDSFSFKFIKVWWKVLKDDIMRFMREFHSYGVLPRGGNPSFITLIPKVENH